jgi:hypothetical protein
MSKSGDFETDFKKLLHQLLGPAPASVSGDTASEGPSS